MRLISRAGRAGRGARANVFPKVFACACLIPLLLFPDPARADRHCYPALDAYYDARTLGGSATATCPQQKPAVLEAVDNAAAMARICSCAPLESALGALADRLRADEGCAELNDIVRSAEDAIKSQIDLCHH